MQKAEFREAKTDSNTAICRSFHAQVKRANNIELDTSICVLANFEPDRRLHYDALAYNKSDLRACTNFAT